MEQIKTFLRDTYNNKKRQKKYEKTYQISKKNVFWTEKFY